MEYEEKYCDWINILFCCLGIGYVAGYIAIYVTLNG